MNLTPAQRARAAALLAEGMPASWVAEDIGTPRKWVYLAARSTAEAIAAWASAWSGIRTNPELRALHAEFQPAPKWRD